MTGWLKDGRVKYQETILDGFERAPDLSVRFRLGGARNEGWTNRPEISGSDLVGPAMRVGAGPVAPLSTDAAAGRQHGGRGRRPPQPWPTS